MATTKTRKFLFILGGLIAFALAQDSHALLPAQQIDANQAPSTVAFVIIPPWSKCTAVKVAPKIFLTAAHCFKLYTKKADVSLERVSKGKRIDEVRTQITNLEIHPGYGNPSQAKMAMERAIGSLPDLALFKTKDDINIPSAKINFDDVKVGQSILVGGFGDQGRAICHPIDHPCSLSMAIKPISRIDHDTFFTEPTKANPFFLTPGDSGGPAYIKNAKTHQLEVVGINSMTWAFSIAELINTGSREPRRTASAYTKISEYEAWYVNIVRELSREPQNPNFAEIIDSEN